MSNSIVNKVSLELCAIVVNSHCELHVASEKSHVCMHPLVKRLLKTQSNANGRKEQLLFIVIHLHTINH